eukprot:5383487-Pyramimonas_sp.AAC.1
MAAARAAPLPCRSLPSDAQLGDPIPPSGPDRHAGAVSDDERWGGWTPQGREATTPGGAGAADAVGPEPAQAPAQEGRPVRDLAPCLNP